MGAGTVADTPSVSARTMRSIDSVEMPDAITSSANAQYEVCR